MSDPMTEGAKTGTASDTPRCDADRSWPNHSWVKTETAEAIEQDLTEALKVAGEALTKIGSLSHWIGTIRWGYDGDCGSTEKASEIDGIISETRAALERIRNKG